MSKSARQKEIKRMNTAGNPALATFTYMVEMVHNTIATQQKEMTKAITRPQEDTMHTTDTNHPEVTARALLNRDLRNIYLKHDEKLEKHFHVRDDDAPETGEDAIERIKAGKFQLKPKEQRCVFDHWTNHLRWRDPEAKKDIDGYKAANEKLKTAYTHAIQDVTVDPLEKAKAALRKFEDATFH